MGWVSRKTDEHKCPKPEYDRHDSDMRAVQTGDVWECDDCHQQYAVKVEYDQRDDTRWFTWTPRVVRRTPAPDRKKTS